MSQLNLFSHQPDPNCKICKGLGIDEVFSDGKCMCNYIDKDLFSPLSHPLGTLLRNKASGEIYRLRQLPIKKNTNEPRTRYLLSMSNNREYIYNPDPSEWELHTY